LEQALATEFTPKKGSPRACQIESFDRHLDGGVQLGILIEDNAQRQLEFGEDNCMSLYESILNRIRNGFVV
jgi:hypothetical protein